MLYALLHTSKAYITIAIRLRYHDASTMTEVIKITICAFDSTAIRLRRKIDVFFFARVEWKQARAKRRSQIEVVS